MDKILGRHFESLVDIEELNRSYVLLAQRLLYEDWTTGMASLGVGSKEAAGILATLTPEQATKLSRCGQLVCRFGLEAHAVLSALATQANRQSSDAGAPGCTSGPASGSSKKVVALQALRPSA